ncbi:MAG: transcriptional regulator [Methylophilaceae bacterium]
MKLHEYIKPRGKGKELALKLNVSPVLVSQWSSLDNPRPVPIERCYSIELATNGKVTRPELRPDDWKLIWPELLEKKVA